MKKEISQFDFDSGIMGEALAQAKIAYKKNEVPVGCVITWNDVIISKAYNIVESKQQTTSHCEIMAIQKAQKKLGYKFLSECTLYCTLEPCTMCAGAIILARIPRIVFGARDLKTGAFGGLYNILDAAKFNHNLEVISGVKQDECSILLTNFFKELRKKV